MLAAETAPACQIARALLVSRQSLYKQSRPRRPVRRPAPRPQVRETPVDLKLDPATVPLEEALAYLGRKHVAAGYRKLTARLRRHGYCVNKKRVQRLLRLWNWSLRKPRPHPKPQGRPFVILAPNQLWQHDLTAVWCGEDGWGYFTALIDCFDRSILGWTFRLRCRARDVSPALEMAWATAWPHGRPEDAPAVVVRHDNGTQFTSAHYREVADTLGLKLSRTAYRHPDGNAFVERVFRSLKEEEVWPNEYSCFAEALAAIAAWVEDYNRERPHQSLKDRTPQEVRAEALASTQSAA